MNSISRSLLKDNIRNALAFRLVAGCRNIDSLLTIQSCNKLQLFIHTFYLFQPPVPKRHPLLCGEIIFTWMAVFSWSLFLLKRNGEWRKWADSFVYAINKRNTVKVSLKDHKGQQQRRWLRKRQLQSECVRAASNFIFFISSGSIRQMLANLSLVAF